MVLLHHQHVSFILLRFLNLNSKSWKQKRNLLTTLTKSLIFIKSKPKKSSKKLPITTKISFFCFIGKSWLWWSIKNNFRKSPTIKTPEWNSSLTFTPNLTLIPYSINMLLQSIHSNPITCNFQSILTNFNVWKL